MSLNAFAIPGPGQTLNLDLFETARKRTCLRFKSFDPALRDGQLSGDSVKALAFATGIYSLIDHPRKTRWSPGRVAFLLSSAGWDIKAVPAWRVHSAKEFLRICTGNRYSIQFVPDVHRRCCQGEQSGDDKYEDALYDCINELGI